MTPAAILGYLFAGYLLGFGAALIVGAIASLLNHFNS